LLDGINLELSPGQHLAVVGASGCGKSTLIRLVAGLYQPWSGEILYDGLPWLAYPDAVVRSQLAYVPQEVFVLNGTISDNLTLWNPAYNDADQLAAAADACLDAVILAHPDGLQRQLRDNGSDLSGGQRQRLEIARALLRQPALLLLDEATSSLDNASEAAILAAIQRRRISVISVAHRLTTALAADQVVVMEAGRILEQGPPAALAANPDGAFSQLLHLERGQAA
jgi:ATP-binding cassette subfamily B protein